MFNPYLYEKLAQAHYQELFQEAQRQRLLAQLPRRHPDLMQSVAGRLVTFRVRLPFSAKQVVQPARTVTDQL